MTAEFTAVQAKFQEAFACHQKGQSEAARRLYQDVLALAPQHFDALHFSGVLAAQAGAYDQAADLIGRALALNPNHASARYNLGLALGGLKRHAEALAAYDQTLTINPDHAGAHLNRGAILRLLGRHQDALLAYDRTVVLQPSNAEAHYNRGIALKDLGRTAEALTALENALTLDPRQANAHFLRGVVLLDLKRPEEALAALDQALALKADYPHAHFSRASALRQLGRLDEALDSYDKVLAANYNVPDTLNERGLVLLQLKRAAEALADLAEAVRLKPDFADAYANRGIALADLKRFEDAIADYDKTIALKPGFAEVHHNRAVALMALDYLEQAVEGYRNAIALRPDLMEPQNNLAYILLRLKQYDAAIAAQDAVLAKDDAYPFLYGLRLHTRTYMCDWNKFDEESAILAEKIARGDKASPPLPTMSLFDSPALHRKSAEAWTAKRHPENSALGAIPKRAFKAGDKIRIGYFSMDFHNHPVGQLLAGLIEQHDRTRFEVYGFSFGPDTKDDLRMRFEKAFDTFLDVRANSDVAVAQLARQHGIDIAIDLAGHTGEGRTNIFALRAAPIQVNYLGYPGTMGAPYMDYIIGDKTVIPAQDRSAYAEKIVWLPGSYQANDSQRLSADRVFARSELNLPENGFVYCCFNSTHKIAPPVFAAWMEILRAVDGSVLWLLEDHAVVIDNLRRHAARHGIDPARLIFAPRVPLSDYLARQRAADLFLDTLPYNAHTTGSDALWVGLPVLTRQGHSFPGRVMASLLKAVGLAELITESRQDYVERAIALARDPVWLADVKDKLARNRFTGRLFDTAGFARHIEDAYHAMHVRYRNGEAPGHITVMP